MIFLKVRLVHTPTSAPSSGTATPLPTSSAPARSTLRTTLARIDYLGSSLLVTTVGTLLLALSFKTASTGKVELAWSDPQVWGLLVASGVGFVLFLLVEGCVAPEPVLPLRLLKRRTPTAVAISNFAFSVNAFSVVSSAVFHRFTLKCNVAVQRPIVSERCEAQLLQQRWCAPDP